MNEKLHTEKTILTVQGHYIDVFDPDPDTIDIIDIAYGLSHESRWGGQTCHFYSVAQHSIRVCNRLPQHLKLEGLLHDATEGFLHDMPKPIKRLLPDYNRIEKNLDRAIRKKFGLPEIMSPEVKSADVVELEWEWDHVKMQVENHAQPMYQIRDEFLRLFYEFIS